MNAAIVENGVVTNVIVVGESTNLAKFGAILSEDARIGWLYDGETFTPPPADPILEPVPQFISDRQFAQQLAKLGLIANEEALAWVKAGVVPAAFDAFVQSLPEAQQFDAEMLLSGATQFDRYHQLTETFGAARGMTSEQIDDLWRAASAL